MFRFAIERGIILSVGFLILCLFGLIALLSVPVQMTPNLDRPVISVLTYWPGATPLDVEKEILIEQEEFLKNVRNLDRMVSTASMATAEIEMEFVLGTDMGEALVRVNNALSQVPGYPENVDQPRLISSSSSDDPFIFYRISNLPDAAVEQEVLGQFDFIEDTFATALERVHGVTQVTVFGGSKREMHIALDPAQLAARGLSMAEVRETIRLRNRDVSGGDIESGKRRYVVRTLGRFDSVESINRSIVAERSGHPVRLGDIGSAQFGVAELHTAAFLNNDRAIVMMLRREPGANVIKVKREVTAAIAELNKTMLAGNGLVAELYADDVGYVVNAVKVVQKNLLLGGLLACTVLFFFLRSIFPTLLGALGVPICAIGALIGLLLMGRSVNVISLAGVAFAIGMTLDNSIVVLENIYRKRAAGDSPMLASLHGVSEMWRAVLASTLTTVFVFLPIAFIDDEAGQLYSDIAVAISAAVLMSMLVAVTLVPSAMARIPLGQPGQMGMHGRSKAFTEKFFTVLNGLLSSPQRQLALVVGILLLAALVIAFLTPKAEYLPEGEEPKLFALMFSPPGHNRDAMYETGRRLADGIVPATDLPADASYGPNDIPPLKYFLWLASPDRLLTIVEPKTRDAATVEHLQRVLRQRFSEVPGMIAFVNKGSIFSDNMGGTRSIELQVSGSELSDIFKVALLAYQSTDEIFDSAQIRPDPGLSLSQPAIEIVPDWDRASELGIKAGDLGYLVGAMTNGAYVDSFYLADDKIDMYLYSTEGTVEKPEDIAAIPVYTDSGGVLPLSAVAQLHETVSANRIRRVDGRRSVTLNVIPPRDIALERAVELVQKDVIAPLLEGGQLPDGVNIAIGGASDKLAATRDALSGNFLIAIALSYLLMVAIFSHWGYPLLILFSLPLGISGGLAGLWFMNNVLGVVMPLDMITLLGMIVLIGTVVNNPILLVEQARHNLKLGMEPVQAVTDSVRVRLRPIMMSMLTTIFGLAPVVFLPGAGTELYRGLGAIVLFGLFFSTLLALTFMPALLVLIFRAGAWWRDWYRSYRMH